MPDVALKRPASRGFGLAIPSKKRGAIGPEFGGERWPLFLVLNLPGNHIHPDAAQRRETKQHRTKTKHISPPKERISSQFLPYLKREQGLAIGVPLRQSSICEIRRTRW
jgi:hypothetical protein